MSSRRTRAAERPPAPEPPALPAAMPVRSVRLPDRLWRQVEAITAELSRGADRRRSLSLSTTIRALLEHALALPNVLDAIGPEARTLRPDRVHRERAARLAAGRIEADAKAMAIRVDAVVDRREITPARFAAEVGGSPHDAQRFFYGGSLPDGDPTPFVERVRNWLAEHEGPERV